MNFYLPESFFSDEYFEKEAVPQICTEKIIGMGSIKPEENSDTQDSVIQTSTGAIVAPNTGIAPNQAIGGVMIVVAIILAVLTIAFSKTKNLEAEEKN